MFSSCFGRFMLCIHGGSVSNQGAMNARAALHTATQLMKGHSKWQNIKQGKAKVDNLRATMMQEYYRRAKAAVRNGGGSFDVSKNKHLSTVLADWLAASLPKEKFIAHLKKIQAAPESTSITVQFSGPAGTLFIAEAEVESRSRFSRHVHKWVEKSPGFAMVVRPLTPVEFREQGVLIIDSKKANGEEIEGLEEAEELAIELECEEVSELEPSDDEEGAGEKTNGSTADNGGGYVLVCAQEELVRVESKLRSQGYIVKMTQVEKIPENRVKLEEDVREKVEKFVELLKSTDEVRDVYDNVEVADE